MIVLPEDDGPNSCVKSTVMVRVLPLTESLTFFTSNLRASKYELGSKTISILQSRGRKSEHGAVGGGIKNQVFSEHLVLG